MLFPHSLINKGNDWYLDQPTLTMSHWDVLEEKFLNRLFPHNKFMEAKTTISMLSQGTTEGLCETCERYKPMLKRCQNNGFNELT